MLTFCRGPVFFKHSVVSCKIT